MIFITNYPAIIVKNIEFPNRRYLGLFSRYLKLQIWSFLIVKFFHGKFLQPIIFFFGQDQLLFFYLWIFPRAHHPFLFYRRFFYGIYWGSWKYWNWEYFPHGREKELEPSSMKKLRVPFFPSSVSYPVLYSPLLSRSPFSFSPFHSYFYFVYTFQVLNSRLKCFFNLTSGNI